MFKNYLKLTIRNLARNKIYSSIDIAGLSIGLACAMLILLYVKDEVSFDRFHSNVDHIYRVVIETKRGTEVQKDGNTGYLQGPRFAANVPGIDQFVRIASDVKDIQKGSDVQSESLLTVDSNFFRVFSFPLIAGNSTTCLREPHSIVLSKSAALRQFGKTDVIGKVIMIREDSSFKPYTVTAVAANTPQNSSIQFDMLLPFQENEGEMHNDENWFNSFLNTFVVVNTKADLAQVESNMQKFYVRNAGLSFKAMIEKYGGGPDANMGKYFLQPFDDMHLNAELPPQNGLEHPSNPMYSYILSGIALFVLLIACINFINLTVARSVKRAKEIGIRKVVGSNRRQLITQFLGESFLISFLAFTIAIGLAIIILPVFNELSDKALSFTYLLDAELVAGYVLLFIITSLLAGFYPALVLSGYRPVETLYKRFTLKGKNYLQKSLVVLQFGLASFLIIVTFTIYKQFNFLTHYDLGYDDNNVIVVKKAWLQRDQANTFRSTLISNPNIIEVGFRNGGMMFTGARLANDSSISFRYETIDQHYLSNLKIPVVAGRTFTDDYASEAENNILVNQSFVEKAQWKDPIGQTVNFFYDDNKIYHVVGVVKDYHASSLNEKIKPQLFTLSNKHQLGEIYIRIKPNTAAASQDYIQKQFKQFFPMSPYSYSCKDEANRAYYEAEAKWKQIILFGAVLTIFISCIGLFGLSVLSAEKRVKEIGIRKVLGASVNNLVTALSKDFLLLVAISLVIAGPFAWIATNKWLEKYPYRINTGWEQFAGPALLVIVIALLTVSFQSIKAAIANPVKSLRSE